MEQYLITGSSGFIAGHLVAHLQAIGHQTMALPRELLYNKNRLIEHLGKLKPDYILHLAAYGNKHDQIDIEQIIQANVIALFNLLFASKNIDYKAFLNFSSSSTLLEYETFYSATKGAGERLVKAFVAKFDKPVITVRPYSVYGPDDDPKHFIPVAINAFKEGSELNLAYGDHDWIYIDDIISGVWKILEHVDELKGQCVDIGTGLCQSNYAIVSILKDIFLQKNIRIKRVGKLRNYDCENWVADNQLLKSFGWEPKTTLEEGLIKIIYGNQK